MGRAAADAMNDPAEIILARARTYAYRARYLQVQVFTKYVTETDLLIQTYGGHSYKHGTGFIWMLSNREAVIKLVRAVEDRLPSENGFENLIITGYL